MNSAGWCIRAAKAALVLVGAAFAPVMDAFISRPLRSLVTILCCLVAAGSAALAHPRCDVSASYQELKSKYHHVVRGTPVVLDQQEENGVLTGTMALRSLRFVKWPKSQSKPAQILVHFSYERGSDCDWRPNTIARKFVLQKSNADYIIVSAF